MLGPCAKRRVRAVLVSRDGEIFTGENLCLTPQQVCPRSPGDDYEKCSSVCNQIGHAEIVALAQAGERANGGALSINHDRVCEECSVAIEALNVSVRLGAS